MAVLLPPIIRQRFDAGSASSVSDFRRQLHTLSRTQAPYPGSPMRAMARPLAPSPRYGMRAPAPGHSGPMPRPARSHAPRLAEHPRVALDEHREEAPARPRRSHHTSEMTRSHYAPEEAYMSPREVIRRRRVNTFYGLLAANGFTLFLAFTTGSTLMVWGFALALLGLGVYCYILVQIRNQEYLRRYYGQHRAA